jgi:NAD(P) transhydrogenase subunit alpha
MLKLSKKTRSSDILTNSYNVLVLIQYPAHLNIKTFERKENMDKITKIFLLISTFIIAAVPVFAADTQPAQSSNVVNSLFVFMLATFIGLGVIQRVSRLLHTPLMSLTNAISAIAVVGSIVITGGGHPLGITILGAVALFASMTNIVSGFLITDRMLKMFKKDRQK